MLVEKVSLPACSSCACNRAKRSVTSLAFSPHSILCRDRIMPTRSSEPKNHELAIGAIGEKLAGYPLDDPNAGKNPAAVGLGKLGGAKAGAAKPAALSTRRHQAIAKRAARARWGSHGALAEAEGASSPSRRAGLCL